MAIKTDTQRQNLKSPIPLFVFHVVSPGTQPFTILISDGGHNDVNVNGLQFTLALVPRNNIRSGFALATLWGLPCTFRLVKRQLQ